MNSQLRRGSVEHRSCEWQVIRVRSGHSVLFADTTRIRIRASDGKADRVGFIIIVLRNVCTASAYRAQISHILINIYSEYYDILSGLQIRVSTPRLAKYRKICADGPQRCSRLSLCICEGTTWGYLTGTESGL